MKFTWVPDEHAFSLRIQSSKSRTRYLLGAACVFEAALRLLAIPDSFAQSAINVGAPEPAGDRSRATSAGVAAVGPSYGGERRDTSRSVRPDSAVS